MAVWQIEENNVELSKQAIFSCRVYLYTAENVTIPKKTLIPSDCSINIKQQDVDNPINHKFTTLRTR